MRDTLQTDTVVVGAGQAGLATGFYLRQHGRDFVILDANPHVGDAWRNRWDSLHLFTPAGYDELPGMRFPAPAHSFPSKNEMADYLEAYASRFALPVQTSVRVEHLMREHDHFIVMAGDRRYTAQHVVVAMATYQRPHVPSFASDLDPEIVQMHSSAYRNPSQLRQGDVLIVGAGNSGAEIALDVAGGHHVWLSGRDTGHIPFRIDGAAARLLMPLLFRGVFHRVLTTDTARGQKARVKFLAGGGPLIRVKPSDLVAAGVERVPRVAGVRDGRPVLEGGQVLQVANVVWCTGFTPDFSWIDLPDMGQSEPMHRRGIVASEPGLYFVGLAFLYAMSSSMIYGMCRDAHYVVRTIASGSR